MKLLFEAEDCVVGIGVGLLMIGLSEFYFTVPNWPVLWGIAFLISLIFSVLDVFYTFSDFGEHIGMHVLLLLNNLVDGFIELALAAKFLGFEIPTISEFLNPFLEDPVVLFWVGVFFIGSSIFWLIYTPFMK